MDVNGIRFNTFESNYPWLSHPSFFIIIGNLLYVVILWNAHGQSMYQDMVEIGNVPATTTIIQSGMYLYKRNCVFYMIDSEGKLRVGKYGVLSRRVLLKCIDIPDMTWTQAEDSALSFCAINGDEKRFTMSFFCGFAMEDVVLQEGFCVRFRFHSAPHDVFPHRLMDFHQHICYDWNETSLINVDGCVTQYTIRNGDLILSTSTRHVTVSFFDESSDIFLLGLSDRRVELAPSGHVGLFGLCEGHVVHIRLQRTETGGWDVDMTWSASLTQMSGEFSVTCNQTVLLCVPGEVPEVWLYDESNDSVYLSEVAAFKLRIGTVLGISRCLALVTNFNDGQWTMLNLPLRSASVLPFRNNQRKEWDSCTGSAERAMVLNSCQPNFKQHVVDMAVTIAAVSQSMPRSIPYLPNDVVLRIVAAAFEEFGSVVEHRVR